MQEKGSETFILPATAQFGYHSKCGRNVVLTDNGLRAKKIGNTCCNGVVYSALPLNDTAEFEVVISYGSVCIGVARYKTGHIIPCRDSRYVTNHCVWNYCIHTLYNYLGSNHKVQSYGIPHVSVNEGDRVGLRLSCDGKLVFLVNGVSQGVAAENVYEEGYDVYAVVDHLSSYGATVINRAVSATPIHSAAWSCNMEKLRGLKNSKYNVNCTDTAGQTPLHYACSKGHLDVVKMLILDFKADVNCTDSTGQTFSCIKGQVNMVKTLSNSKADAEGNTALMSAALAGHESVVHMILNEQKCIIEARHKATLLHLACKWDNISLVRVLIHEYEADVNVQDVNGNTALMIAALAGHENVVHTMLSERKCLIDARHKDTLLLLACKWNNISLVRVLIHEYKADVNAQDVNGNTAIMSAAQAGHESVVHTMLSEHKCPIDARHKATLLHLACKWGNISLVRVLIHEYKADVNDQDVNGNTALMLVALAGHESVVHILSECKCPIDTRHKAALLRLACEQGNIGLVRVLIHEYEADVNDQDGYVNTALMSAALAGHESLVHTILSERKCLINARHKAALFHLACKLGNISLVRVLIHDYEADVNDKDVDGNTALMSATLTGHERLVRTILSEFMCPIDARHKDALLRLACKLGNISLVRVLIHEYETDVNAEDVNGNTILMSAALAGQESVVHKILSQCICPIDARHKATLLHLACELGNISLVHVLMEYKADVNVQDKENNTPLHIAVMHGHEKVVLALINIIGCDTNVRGDRNRHVLHLACAKGHANIVRSIGKSVSLLAVDDNGDTPLHICSALGNSECVEALLQLNAPVLIRNNAGKTPRELASHSSIIGLFNKYMIENKNKISAYYNNIQKCASKKYSSAEHITRLFVIGNPGAGKSSLVETLKREALFDSFRGASSVPLHTAGIVPSVHTSKHYGRALFYDFAGDPEYYSSHAAILENLASSRKGDNIFIIVVDLREESVKINLTLNYWISFIQHQKFGGKKPSLILIGSHADLITTEDITKKEKHLKRNCTYFLLNCCMPKSRQIGEIQKKIVSLTMNSPSYRLSLEASMLLGLLEKDFGNVTACSIQTLLSHIEITGIALPTRAHSLYPILYELHEIGLLFMVNDSNMDKLQVVLNMSQLTNKVHQLLFSEEAELNLKENCENNSFNIGVIPISVLQKVLPEYITKECLVQLQYCQEISHKDVGAFSFLTQSNSTGQSFLFFPALCSIDKSKGGASWITLPNLGYHIGWLARCTGSRDYFPPRFLHVLLLRLVFGFTVTQKQAASASFDHSCFKRSCKMWKSGVYWLMEQGVECLVELVNANKEVVVLTKIIPCKTEKGTPIGSNKNRAEFCAFIFTRIISCVMEAKAEFCHSIRPEFFLLDSLNETDYLNPDNLFAMSSVERILACPEGKEVIVSVAGMRYMEFSKLLCMREFTHWHSLFPTDLTSVLYHLKGIVSELFDFGLHLKMSPSFLKTLEADFPRDINRRKTELILEWMSSSLDPPCWWHLVQALIKIERSAIAEEVRKKHRADVQLQEKLLDQHNVSLKPDKEFLELFAGIVGSKWTSLAASLSLSESEIEEVKGGNPSQQDHALQMLMKWVKREDATYGQLYQKLKTISLFQYGNE